MVLSRLDPRLLLGHVVLRVRLHLIGMHLTVCQIEGFYYSEKRLQMFPQLQLCLGISSLFGI